MLSPQEVISLINQLPPKVKTFTLNPETGNVTVELFAPESPVATQADSNEPQAGSVPRRRQMSGIDSLSISPPTFSLEDVEGGK